MTAKTISNRAADYDIVYDTLGGAFTVDAFKMVKRGGAVISLSGPPDRDFAGAYGRGLGGAGGGLVHEPQGLCRERGFRRQLLLVLYRTGAVTSCARSPASSTAARSSR